MNVVRRLMALLLLATLLAACGSAPAAQSSTALPSATSETPASVATAAAQPTNPPAAPTAAPTAAAPTVADQANTTFPLTIENCGNRLTFEKPPERVLVTYQNIAETLLKLGLKDKIVGVTYGQAYNPPADMAADVNSLNYLSPRGKGSAAKEVELNTRPDVVISAYPTADFDAAKGMATQADFQAAGAPVYGTSAECQKSVPDGSIETVYNDILNFGRIFGIESRAQAVVQDMRDRIAAVQKRVAGRPTVSVAFYDAGEDQLGFYGSGLNSDMIKLAGGANVFADQPEAYLQVGKEAFATKNPDIFAVLDYEDQPSVPDEPARAAFLFTTFPNMTASQQKRWVAVSGAAFAAGIRIPDAIEVMAKAFHPEAFGAAPEITAQPSAASYPVTIENCGQKLTFAKAPERVVPLYSTVTELLLALGLKNRIVAAGFTQSEPLLPEYQADYTQLPSLSTTAGPTKEALISMRPDFVLDNDSTYFYDAAQGFATKDELKAAGAQTYTLTTRCPGAETKATVESIYTDLRNMGIIFGVQAKAEGLVQQIQQRIAASQQKVAGAIPQRVLIFDSGEGPYNVYGPGVISSVVAAAGGQNIFATLDKEYTGVSAEQIAAANPQVFVIPEYGPAYTGAPSAKDRGAALVKTFTTTDAARNNRVVIIPYQNINASMQNAIGVETLAKALHPEAFK